MTAYRITFRCPAGHERRLELTASGLCLGDAERVGAGWLQRYPTCARWLPGGACGGAFTLDVEPVPEPPENERGRVVTLTSAWPSRRA